MSPAIALQASVSVWYSSMLPNVVRRKTLFPLPSRSRHLKLQTSGPPRRGSLFRLPCCINTLRFTPSQGEIGECYCCPAYELFEEADTLPQLNAAGRICFCQRARNFVLSQFETTRSRTGFRRRLKAGFRSASNPELDARGSSLSACSRAHSIQFSMGPSTIGSAIRLAVRSTA